MYRQEDTESCAKEDHKEVVTEQSDESLDIFERLKKEVQLDVETGIGYCMNRDFYLEVLKDYMNGNKNMNLEELFEKKDWENYPPRPWQL